MLQNAPDHNSHFFFDYMASFKIATKIKFLQGWSGSIFERKNEISKHASYVRIFDIWLLQVTP